MIYIDTSITLFLTFVAYQNYKIQKNKLRVELYEKRYQTYSEIHKFLSTIAQKGSLDNADIIKFSREVYKNEFLFGSEVKNFIDSIHERACRLMAIISVLDAEQIGGSRDKICKEKWEIIGWSGDQFNESRKIFRKYLSFNIFSFKSKLKNIREFFKWPSENHKW